MNEDAFELLNEIQSKHRPNEVGVCYEGDEFLARLSARDPEQEAVTYLLTGGSLPNGAFLDPAQGTVSGTLNLKHFDTDEVLMGDHTWYFTVGAFDGVNIKDQKFAITVKHINLPAQWNANSGGLILELYEGDNITNGTVLNTNALVPVDQFGNIALDQFGNPVVGDNANSPVNSVGFKILGAVDPEFEFNPNSVIQPLTYRATGMLFDHDTPNTIHCTIQMDANGIITGSLPPISPDQLVGRDGYEFPMQVFAFDGEFDQPRAFSIFVKNVNRPPEWQTPAEGADLGTYIEGTAIAPITLTATDVDLDALTYSVSNVTVGNGVATTLSNAGLSVATVNNTAVITGTPSNALVPPIENISNTVWYIADPTGTNITLAGPSYYNVVNSISVFQSKPSETIFVTTSQPVMNPPVGSRYKISYSIRKIQDPSSLGPAYIRPAFDVLVGGAYQVVSGQRSGFGYVSDINNVGYDFFDTSMWTLGTWYLVTAEYTTTSAYAAIRGRIRINRRAINAGGPPYWNGSGYINRTDGPPYSDAIFQMRGYSIEKNDNQTYNFTANVTDGEYTVSRNYHFTIGNLNLPPVWDTAAGSLGSGFMNSPFSFNLSAHDPEGASVSYTLVGGSLPPNLTMTTGGVIAGTLAAIPGPGDVTSSFTVRASDGAKTADRSFTITTKYVLNGPPVFTTPAGQILAGEAGTPMPAFQLAATDPENDPINFTATGLPAGVSVSSSGLVTGTFPSPAGTYTFSATANAVGGTDTRSFSIATTITVVPFDVAFDTESVTTASGFPPNLSSTAPGTDYTFTISAGVHAIKIDWIIGGGGAGGAGTQLGSGGGGGGGGSAGWYQDVYVPCNPGDLVTVHVGPGGGAHQPPNVTTMGLGNGDPGGDSYVTINGTTYTATGGGGGHENDNLNHGSITAPGGAGGSPNGIAGATGPAGTSDYSSSPGGAGAPGPTVDAVPGQGGAGGNAGPGAYGGVGGTVGSGGGGGGSYDRSGPFWWQGGDGHHGFIRIRNA